jgi:hypothetical protein
MSQAVQIFGALAILVGYGLAQMRLLDERSYPYLALNLGGAVLLGVLAWLERQWGFFVLEVAWTAITAVSLAARLRR